MNSTLSVEENEADSRYRRKCVCIPEQLTVGTVEKDGKDCESVERLLLQLLLSGASERMQLPVWHWRPLVK